MKSSLTAAAMALALWLLPACKTTLDNVSADPGFTYSEFQSGGIVVVGAVDRTARNPADTEQVSFPQPLENTIAADLTTALSRERKHARVLSANFVLQKLQPQDYGNLMVSYLSQRRIDDAALADLEKALPDVRYAAFCALETDEVSHMQSSGSNTDEKGVRTETEEYSTLRRVGMVMDVYDLKTRRPVWYGRHATATSTSNKYESTPQPKQGVLQTIVTSLVSSALEPERRFPEPPPKDVAAASVLKAFAENMPEEP